MAAKSLETKHSATRSPRPRSGLPPELSQGLFTLFAVCLPLGFWLLHHNLGHEGDIRFFYEWFIAFRRDAAFYRDGPGLNYPVLGVLLVCGPARLVEAFGVSVDFEVFRFVLKATLVLWEMAFIPIAAGLARELAWPRPRTTALFLYVLPSTWATGAAFGQIDVAGTALLLSAASALVRFRRLGTRTPLVLGLVALVAALLTKQLTWFCAPPLLILTFLGLMRWRKPALWCVALATPILFFVADPFVDLPSGYFSHLHFVLAGGGSSHGDLVVASGASVWSVFYSGGTPSEDVRLVFSSFVWGWLFWGLCQLRVLWHLRRTQFSSRALLWWAGMSQFAMCSLMTGVHERYFAHAFPFLLLTLRALGSKRSLLLPVLSVWSGVYVIATIVPGLEWTLLGRAQPLAALTFAGLMAELYTGPDSADFPQV